MSKENGKKEYPLWVLVSSLSVLLLICVVFALCLGKYPVTAGESLGILFRSLFGLEQKAGEMTVNVVTRLRLPRVLAAVLVGAALSLSGAAYQGIFKNPLVSPDFLGVSSGACIGAAAAILLGAGSGLISILAFAGGIAAVLVTSGLPVMLKNRSDIMLVLSGIIVGSLMSSVLGFLKYIADPATQLASITYWTMGSFSYVSAAELKWMCLVLIPPMSVLLLMSWWFDVLSMGEPEARALGADVRKVRTIAIACSTLLTAGSVCVAGTIGWVGLIIPHFSRMLAGSANRRLMPVSCILGGLFMLVVDTVTRTVGVSEMPVSIMTGIIGAPFFCRLLYRKRGDLS